MYDDKQLLDIVCNGHLDALDYLFNNGIDTCRYNDELFISAVKYGHLNYVCGNRYKVLLQQYIVHVSHRGCGLKR
jgi:hypothetical protein